MAQVMDLPHQNQKSKCHIKKRYIGNFTYMSFAAAVYVIGMGGEGGWWSDCLDFQGPPLEMDLIYFKIINDIQNFKVLTENL